MRADAVLRVPLVCVVCRTAGEHGRDLYTLEVDSVARSSGDEIDAGVLRCVNPACGRRYPIVGGIPIIVGDLAGWQARELPELTDEPNVAALFAEAGPDDAPAARTLEHLSIYLDSQWGDRATPPPDGPGAPYGFGALAERLSGRPPVERAVELGCSVGRGLAALSAGAQITVGVDLSFASLLRAQRLLRGDSVAYARRLAGRHYSGATTRGVACANVVLVCGDALDPPLAPLGFDRVVALNIIDAVRDPVLALTVAAGFCARGGELHLASPYAWQSSHVEEGRRLGGTDPAAEVTRRLRAGEGVDGAFTVEEEANLAWSLRRDTRSAVAYSVHYVRGKKG